MLLWHTFATYLFFLVVMLTLLIVLLRFLILFKDYLFGSSLYIYISFSFFLFFRPTCNPFDWALSPLLHSEGRSPTWLFSVCEITSIRDSTFQSCSP